jgi:hypothetical protein
MKKLYTAIIRWILTCMLFVINKIMYHFLVLQGLDPNASPGQTLYKSLANIFDNVERLEYDPDQENFWLKKQYSKIHDKFPDISLDEYKKISNLNKVLDKQPSDPVVEININAIEAVVKTDAEVSK